MASVASDGTQHRPLPILGCFPDVDISGNGRYVAFASSAANLAPGTNNAACDVFRHDLQTGRTDRVSVSPQGTDSLGACPYAGVPDTASRAPSLDHSGRYVAFMSCATNLVPGDTNLAADFFVRDMQTGRTTRVSVASDGTQQESPDVTRRIHWSGHPSISANGRFVAFDSIAANLVSDDTNEAYDAFVHDRKTRETFRVSVATGGGQLHSQEGTGSDRAGTSPSISGNGRHVAFNSFAEELAPPDSKLQGHVYVHDIKTQETEIISVSSQGEPARLPLMETSQVGGNGRQVSHDGRYVAFGSFAPNLVPNDTNRTAPGIPNGVDIFVRDRKAGRTERVSVTSAGEESAPGNAFFGPAMSADGRFVTFAGNKDGFDAWDGQAPMFPLSLGNSDIYVYDRAMGTVTRISVAPDGSDASTSHPSGFIGPHSFTGALSATGRHVTFWSYADNLVEGDDNDDLDVFVRDYGLDLGVGWANARVAPPGQAGSGFVATFSKKVEEARDGTGLPGAEILGATLAYRPHLSDLFLRIDVDELPALGAGAAGATIAGNPAVVHGARFEVEGHTYEVRIARGDGLSAELDPVFGVFSCERTCTEIAKLDGGYGTTGEQVVAAIPLEAVGLSRGGRIEHAEVFTALGTYRTGPERILDRATTSDRRTD